MNKLINAIRNMWNFIKEEPKERTDEEWEEYFALLEALKRNREINKKRNRKNRIKRPYTAMYRNRTGRRY